MIGPKSGVFIRDGMWVQFLYQIQVLPDNQKLAKKGIKFAKFLLWLG